MQLEGGPGFHAEETRDRVLAESHARTEREQGPLKVTTVDDDGMVPAHGGTGSSGR